MAGKVISNEKANHYSHMLVQSKHLVDVLLVNLKSFHVQKTIHHISFDQIFQSLALESNVR